MSKTKPASAPHSCNVLQPDAASPHLWQFTIEGDEIRLAGEAEPTLSGVWPTRLVTKDWRALWQRKVNLAWLPPDKVFLRVVQLPAADPSELLPMVELQLEKLSPLPITQIVWTAEVLPGTRAAAAPAANSALVDGETVVAEAGESAARADIHTVIVLIAARSHVEAFLGDLEGKGFLADRLDLPVLHQVVEGSTHEDGIWVYPLAMTNRRLAVVAWWQAGVLQNLNLLHLPADDTWSASLAEQLTQMAWAGEMDGWLNAAPRWHLVESDPEGAAWKAALDGLAGDGVTVEPPLSAQKLANLNVKRLTHQEAQANLLPEEYAARYRQQFIDGLWMRGLGVLVAVYLLGLVVYFGVLQWVNFQKLQVDAQVTRCTPEYQTAQQLKARVQILQEQESLKYAALDCYRTTADLLPADVNLTAMNFERGKRLVLYGEAKEGEVAKIYDFNGSMNHANASGTNGVRLFNKVEAPTITTRAGTANIQTWRFTCELFSPEIE